MVYDVYVMNEGITGLGSIYDEEGYRWYMTHSYCRDVLVIQEV